MVGSATFTTVASNDATAEPRIVASSTWPEFVVVAWRGGVARISSVGLGVGQGQAPAWWIIEFLLFGWGSASWAESGALLGHTLGGAPCSGAPCNCRRGAYSGKARKE